MCALWNRNANVFASPRAAGLQESDSNTDSNMFEKRHNDDLRWQLEFIGFSLEGFAKIYNSGLKFSEKEEPSNMFGRHTGTFWFI